MDSIATAVSGFQATMVADRRHLHADPEIGLDLPRTTEYVAMRLREMGIEPRAAGPSGLTACIGAGGRTLLLRADMDALPIREGTDLPFRSGNGFGHCCGHDLHTAMLLGAARVLKAREASLAGTVKLMFQPGEETGAGARSMLAAGLLAGPRVDAAMALHVASDLVPGKVEFKPGIMSASMDGFMVEVQGRGGHSSTPHLAIDPLLIVNTIYMMLNGLVGRMVDPFETAVLTVGKCGGGTAANIIPDTAVLEGGLRCFNQQTRDQVIGKVHEVIESVTRLMGGRCTVRRTYTPPVVNDERLCAEMRPHIEAAVGAGNLRQIDKPLAGTEDFSFISEQVPAMFLMIGAGHPGNVPLHNPAIVFDEAVLPVGATILARCAAGWLAENQG